MEKKRVSSVLLKELQAYLSVIYVTCNTCKRFEYFQIFSLKSYYSKERKLFFLFVKYSCFINHLKVCEKLQLLGFFFIIGSNVNNINL